MLLHLAPYSKEVLLLSGDLGVGKSALLRQFLSKAPENCRISMLSANKIHGTEEFFTALQQALPLHTDEGANSGSTAEDDLRQINSRGQRPVIVIDDAQNLSTELAAVFDRWLNHSAENGDFFSLILSGKTHFDELPAVKTLTRHGFHHFHIDRLSTDMTRQYVLYQLEKSGLPPDRLTPVELEIVCATANGIPGLINAEARKFLSEQAKQAPPLPSEKEQSELPPANPTVRIPVSRYVVPLLVLIAAVTAAAWWAWNLNTLSPPQSPPADPLAQSTPAPEISETPPADTTIESSESTDSSSASESLENNPQGAEGEVEVAMHELPDDIAPIAGELTPEQINAMLEERIARGKQDRPPWEEQAETEAPAEPVPDLDQQTLQPVSEFTAKTAEKTAPTRPSTPKTVIRTAPPVESPPEPQLNLKDADWLLAQDPSHFTLQLIAYGKLTEVQKLADKFAQQDQIAYFPLLRGGKQLFAVVYGVYPDESSARAAIADVPKKLGQLNPIVKSFRSIHKDIITVR